MTEPAQANAKAVGFGGIHEIDVTQTGWAPRSRLLGDGEFIRNRIIDRAHGDGFGGSQRAYLGRFDVTVAPEDIYGVEMPRDDHDAPHDRWNRAFIGQDAATKATGSIGR